MPRLRSSLSLSPLLELPLFGKGRKIHQKSRLIDLSTEELRVEDSNEETHVYYNSTQQPMNSTESNVSFGTDDAQNNEEGNNNPDDSVNEHDISQEERELAEEIRRTEEELIQKRKKSRVEKVLEMKNHLKELQSESRKVGRAELHNKQRKTNGAQILGQPNTEQTSGLPDQSPKASTSTERSSIERMAEIFKIVAKGLKDNDPKPVVFKQQPPKFNGNRDMAMDWLRDYESISAINNWNGEQKSVNLVTAMIDDAKTWYDSVFDGRRHEWTEFEIEFLKFFKPSNYDCEVRHNVYTMRQKTDESPTIFLTRLVKASNRVTPKMSEADILGCLRKGLSNYYAKEILRDKTLDDARETLTGVEKLSFNRDKPKTQFTNNFNRNFQNTRNFNREHVSQNTRFNTKNVDPEKPEFKTQDSEYRFICFNCNGKGHQHRNCPLERNAENIKINIDKWQSRKQSLGSNQINPQNNNNKNVEVNKPMPQTQLKSIVHNSRKRTRSSTELNAKRTKVDKGKAQGFNIETNVNVITAQGSDIQSVFTECMDSSNTPHVNVVFNSKIIFALLDTGSAISVISAKAVHEMQLKTRPWPYGVVNAAGGKTLKPKGLVFNARIAVKDFAVVMTLGVIKNMTPDLILGVDFINSMQLTILTAHRRVIFTEGVIPPEHLKN